MKWHSGPRIDKIPVVGVGGAIFTIGTMVILLIGIPAARWFLLGSAVLGGISGAGLYLWHKRRPIKVTDINSP